MKYKTKLFIVLISLVIVTNGLLLTIFYLDANKHLRQQLNSRSLSVAESVAAIINGDELSKIRTRADEASPIYKRYQDLMIKIRDHNRRHDMYIKYIYTLMLNPNNPNEILFGIDARKEDFRKSHVGDVYTFKSKYPFLLNQAATQPDFIYDKWGVWLTAHAPIYDSFGKLVGAAAIDVDASLIKRPLRHLLEAGFFSLGLSLLLALLLALFLTRRFSKPLETISAALYKIGKGKLDTRVAIHSKDEFADVANSVNEMVVGLRQRDQLKMSLARYVSNQVAEKILATGKLPEVHGELRKTTVLFCDVRNFTKIAEQLSPEEVVTLLNETFEYMIDAIFKYKGMLDKFLGDGFMAIFGAPLDDPLQEEHAIRTALMIQNELKKVAQKWSLERGIEIKMGIGIHTGMAIVGNIGSKHRMEYTAIGDTVNLAARLETATKEFGSRILLSNKTYEAVAGKFIFKSLGSIRIAGRSEPVTVYEVEGEKNVFEK